jgi:hypothetical protein
MKRLFTFIAAMVMLLSVSSFAFAAGEVNQDEMRTHVQKHLAEDHYDFKNGSLELSNEEVINVNDPDGKVSEVWAAHATYNTVRDSIFYFTTKDVVYYDVTNQKVLTATEAAKFKELGVYKKQYEGELGMKMHFLVILSLLALILVVPGVIISTWGKQVYSTTSFKVKNNLYNQTQNFN